MQVKAIAQAHVKTNKIDAGHARQPARRRLSAADLTADAATERKRRLVARFFILLARIGSVPIFVNNAPSILIRGTADDRSSSR
ncbi:hypothetical protein [Bradyrhizobium sp. SRL28]|uniref:hypothetical protein n=1 Tax=Bradyrhizobium sp. SRL28 TaxID=2836178 RepID=UPI00201BA6AE|nr:hypothetical protein [Bradyrhizobium sp. SRL28]